MKLLCVLLLICLLAAGPAAAIAVSPGSVSGAAMVTQTVNPRVSAMPKVTISTIPVATTAPLSPMLYVSSTPSGAAVSVNGVSKGNTPLTLGLYPGTYTVLITLAGYRDYTTTVTLGEGSKVAVDAQLQPALYAGALRQNSAVVATATQATGLNRSVIHGVSLNRTIVPVTTPVPTTVCLSGQSCVTTADAAVLFPPGWYYNVNEICGYAPGPGNELIPRYCVAGNLGPNTSYNCLSGQHCLTLEEAGDTLAAGWYYLEGNTCGWEGTAYSPVPKYCISGTPKGSGLQPGAVRSIAAVQQLTRIPVSFETTTPTAAPGGTKQPLGGKRQAGFVDSFFGFFGGLFSRPVCPAGQTACGSTCTDLMSDPQNCGECDFVCYENAICIQGQCTGRGYSPPLS